MTDKILSPIIDRFDKLKEARDNYDVVFQDLSRYINPNREDFIVTESPGRRRHNKVYDSTGIDAARSLASALTNSITNPQSRWLSMVTREKILMENEDVRQYLDTLETKVLAAFNSVSSSFYQQNHQFMIDLPVYGTACMFVEDTPKGISFKSIPLSQLYIEEDSEDKITTVFRRFEFTARQIIQEWEDSLSEKDLQTFKSDLNRKYKVVHVVAPKAEFKDIPGLEFPDNKAFGSLYYVDDPKVVLNTGSYFDQPYIVGRWEKLTGETYGRGSGWSAISDILMLNVMSESGIRSVQQSSSPAYLVPDDGVITHVRSVPGGITVGGLDEDGNLRVRELPFNPRLDFLEAEKETRRDSVRKAFFVDRFERKEGTPVTATENIDNQQVRLVLAAPQIFRIEVEYLNPLIDRVFGILERKGEIPAAPPILQDQDVDYEYQSPIIKAQRRQELLALNVAIESVGPLVQLNPDLLEVVDAESIFRDNAGIAGVPIRHLKSEQEVAAVRDAKILAAQQAQQREAATEAANTAANLQKSGINVVD
jgi:hypothetical protein